MEGSAYVFVTGCSDLVRQGVFVLYKYVEAKIGNKTKEKQPTPYYSYFTNMSPFSFFYRYTFASHALEALTKDTEDGTRLNFTAGECNLTPTAEFPVRLTPTASRAIVGSPASVCTSSLAPYFLSTHKNKYSCCVTGTQLNSASGADGILLSLILFSFFYIFVLFLIIIPTAGLRAIV